MQESFINNASANGQHIVTPRIKNELFNAKILHTLLLTAAFLLSVVSAAVIAHFGLKAGLLLMAVIITPLAVTGIIVYPKLGIMALLTAAFFIMWIPHFGVTFPVGTLMDGLEALLVFGLLLQLKGHPDITVFKNPISLMVVIWIGYNLLEIVNPVAASRLAWVYTVRTVAVVMLTYFIFLFHIRTIKFIRLIIKTWLALAFFAAAYAFKQEHWGFFPFEEQWLASDPLFSSLYFIDGVWRKFSIFSDPVTFAYNMVIGSILCFSLLTGPLAIWKKVVLSFLGVFFLITMLYSGTRGAYVLVPASLAMFCVLKFNKKFLFVALALAAVLGYLIFAPTSNPSILRFQSAFSPAQDASYNVRANNQKKIQPFILAHPIGGGLGATGVWGKRFSPNSYLANFPPDSGYVRVAVELGWVGLLIFCVFMFVVLKSGINNYYRIRNKELKSYCLAMTLIAFALNIGNFPQEALVQFPTNIYFYLVIALINSTWLIDQKSIS